MVYKKPVPTIFADRRQNGRQESVHKIQKLYVAGDAEREEISEWDRRSDQVRVRLVLRGIILGKIGVVQAVIKRISIVIVKGKDKARKGQN